MLILVHLNTEVPEAHAQAIDVVARQRAEAFDDVEIARPVAGKIKHQLQVLGFDLTAARRLVVEKLDNALQLDVLDQPRLPQTGGCQRHGG
jgi:hypothetical protein